MKGLHFLCETFEGLAIPVMTAENWQVKRKLRVKWRWWLLW